MERVIFRKEKNPYVQSIRCTNREKCESWEETLCNPEYNYLALFIDDEANPGMVECLPFFFDGHVTAYFEAYGEADWGYILTKTRIVHKHDPIAETLLKTVSKYCESELQMVEKNIPCKPKNR